MKDYFRILPSWKLTFDNVDLLDYINRHTLETQDWFKRFLRFSPGLLDIIRHGVLPLEEKGSAFSRAVSWFRFGNIFKLTSLDRTVLADEAILSRARVMRTPTLLEIGSSDGGASLGLFRQSEFFSKIILTDRYGVFYRKRGCLHETYYDADRLAMYLKIGFLSFDLRPLGETGKGGLERIETVNPLVAEQHGVERIESFDMFRDKTDHKFDIIKCSNLLNTSYFSEDVIGSAVMNICESLADDGYLVISQNNEKYAGGEAMFVLQKQDGEVVLIESVKGHDVASRFQPGKERMAQPVSGA